MSFKKLLGASLWKGLLLSMLLLLLLLAVELGDFLLNVGVESLFLSGQLA